jgi:hypothetical protein
MTAEEIIKSNPKAKAIEPRATYDFALMGITSDGRLIYSENKILIALQEIEGLSYEDSLDSYANKTTTLFSNGNRFSPIIATETI